MAVGDGRARGRWPTFGLLATQRVLVELFAGGPTAGPGAGGAARAVLAGGRRRRSAAALGIATGYALNGLTPRVNREVERRLFEATTAVRLEAFDEDAFADDMERASRGTESAIVLVQDVDEPARRAWSGCSPWRSRWS